MYENPYKSPQTPPDKLDRASQRSILWRLQFDPFYVGSLGLLLVPLLFVVAAAVTALVFR